MRSAKLYESFKQTRESWGTRRCSRRSGNARGARDGPGSSPQQGEGMRRVGRPGAPAGRPARASRHRPGVPATGNVHGAATLPRRSREPASSCRRSGRPIALRPRITLSITAIDGRSPNFGRCSSVPSGIGPIADSVTHLSWSEAKAISYCGCASWPMLRPHPGPLRSALALAASQRARLECQRGAEKRI
jgi:hypothetical protein